MREFIDAHDWLTVYQLPPYCPDPNPVEGIWSLLRRKLANTAFTLRRGLREIQYRPQLIEGVLTETGLALHPKAS
jgi:transposase